MASAKGITVTDEVFWPIVLLLLLVVLIGVWLLLTWFFVNFTTERINTQERFCETFEKTPLLGSVACPK